MEDSDIIRLYWQRNEQAITCTGKKYGAYCHRIAINTLSIEEDAEECVNDTYLAAWNTMPPQLPACLRAFLGRLTRCAAISRFRANRAAKRYSGMELMLSELEECVPAATDVEDTVVAGQLATAISGWLDSLPADRRELFVRRYWYGDSVAAIAAAQHIPTARATNRLYELRQALRRTLEKEEWL